MPAALTGVTWTASGTATGFTASGSGNISDHVNFTAGSNVTYLVTATIKSSATGSLSNTATVAAAAGVTDTNTANNSATDTDTLTPKADLAITKADNVGGNSVGNIIGTAIPGTAITYTTPLLGLDMAPNKT